MSAKKKKPRKANSNPDREPHTGSTLYAKRFRASAAELDASEKVAKSLKMSWNEFAREALRNWTSHRKSEG